MERQIEEILKRKARDSLRLERKVRLIVRSTIRLAEALDLPRNEDWWWFVRREAWIHLKRSLELWWMVLRHKG